MVGLVETTLTADSFQLAAYGRGRMRRKKQVGAVAVSRKPMALPDALVYELCGLTEDRIAVVEGRTR